MTAHSIKDLEKILPSVASINGMQVKDYIQALNDEGLIRVEKIGSGNWYWSFLSEEKKNKEGVLGRLENELKDWNEKVTSLDVDIVKETTLREEIEDEDNAREQLDRKTLLVLQRQLTAEVVKLETELIGYSDNDPTEVLKKKENLEEYREGAAKWTENIENLQDYLSKIVAEKSLVSGLMEKVCGDEYVAGEGLRELRR